MFSLEGVECQSVLVNGQFSAGISVKIVHQRPDQYSDNSFSYSASYGANFQDIV